MPVANSARARSLPVTIEKSGSDALGQIPTPSSAIVKLVIDFFAHARDQDMSPRL
jgi:hypothetical protein